MPFRDTFASPVKRSVVFLAAILMLISAAGMGFVYWQTQHHAKVHEDTTVFHMGSIQHILEAEMLRLEIEKHLALERSGLRNARAKRSNSEPLTTLLADKFHLMRGHIDSLKRLKSDFAEPAFVAPMNRLLGDFESFVAAAGRNAVSDGGARAVDAIYARIESLGVALRQLRDLHVAETDQVTLALESQQRAAFFQLAIAGAILVAVAVFVLMQGLRLIDAGRLRELKALEVNARLGRIVEDSWNEIYVFDADTYRFVQVNRGALSNIGYSMEEMQERTAYDIKPDFTEEQFLAAVEPLRDGTQKFLLFETVHQRKDGTTYPVEVRLQLLATENPPVYFAVINDITARKSAEQEIRDINQSLEQRVVQRTAELKEEVEERARAEESLRNTLEELERTQGSLVEAEKMASLGNLVAGVAHEINTPIGIGVTASTHLREYTDNFVSAYRDGRMKRADLEKFVSVADESCGILETNLHRASDLIKSFKQVAVDQTEDSVREFDLKTYVDEVLNSLGPKIRRSSVEVDADITSDIPVEANPGSLSQILTNLVINSLIHGFEDAETGHIRIVARSDGGMVTLEYEDDGKGMDDLTARRVFEPFFTTKRGAGGSGLGMHILFNLVTQSLGGTVTCNSAPGEGVRFAIRFPQYPTQQQEQKHVGTGD